IFTMPQYNRSAHPDDLSKVAQSLGFYNHGRALSINEAMSRVMDLTGHSLQDYKNGRDSKTRQIPDNEPVIVITGSFYLLGELLELLGEKSIYRDLRENFEKNVKVN
ncbi:MAG: hypothetical protein N2738_05485, partial [Thermodesulfovibrionales bacterium]|nr:hypothetical protein [Thermodesulfovibrionales bacterium]